MSKVVKPNAQARIEKAVAKHWSKRGAYAKQGISSAKKAGRTTYDALTENLGILALGVGAYLTNEGIEVAEQAVEAEQIENQISYAEYIARK